MGEVILERVAAVRFDRWLKTGRTRPFLAVALGPEDSQVEVVVKLSGMCERGIAALISEAVAAMFGRDLGLPIPQPYLVGIDAEFAAALPDVELRRVAEGSLGWNFGSERLSPGYMSVPVGKRCPQELIPIAAEVFAFDAMIQNPDRRPENPNCLLKQGQLAIFDHELAFSVEGILNWKPPWEPESLEFMRRGPGKHLFLDQLSGKAQGLERLRKALNRLGDSRVASYEEALPVQWLSAAPGFTKAIFGYLSDLRGKVPDLFRSIQEAMR